MQDIARKKNQPRKRDADRSRAVILQAALEEFSEHGHSGARVDRIASRAGVSKPLIYDYFGDKDAIYAAALKEAYIQIRQGEAALALDALTPTDAVRALVNFTMQHYRDKPWFISMLNTENLRGGDTIRNMESAHEIQSVLVSRIHEVLKRGAESGEFRAGVDPIEFYISIAALCYFPMSNMHTLRAVFHVPVDGPWLERRAEDATRMLLAFLRPDPDAAA